MIRLSHLRELPHPEIIDLIWTLKVVMLATEMATHTQSRFKTAVLERDGPFSVQFLLSLDFSMDDVMLLVDELHDAARRLHEQTEGSYIDPAMNAKILRIMIMELRETYLQLDR